MFFNGRISNIRKVYRKYLLVRTCCHKSIEMSSKNILILVLVILCVVKISKTSQINLNDYPDFEEFGTYSEEKVGENLTKNYGKT